MNETINVVRLRQPEAIDDPLTDGLTGILDRVQ
jgi:hypothetical protein